MLRAISTTRTACGLGEMPDLDDGLLHEGQLVLADVEVGVRDAREDVGVARDEATSLDRQGLELGGDPPDALGLVRRRWRGRLSRLELDFGLVAEETPQDHPVPFLVGSERLAASSDTQAHPDASTRRPRVLWPARSRSHAVALARGLQAGQPRPTLGR